MSMRFAPPPPRADLVGRRSERLGRVGLVPPSVEAEGRFEQRHRAESLLPPGPLSFRCSGELLRLGHRARVCEHRPLQVLERDAEEGSDPHHLVERGLADSPELPALDRAGADAEGLAEPRARVARRLAALLQEPGKSCLLDHRRHADPRLWINRCRSIRRLPRIHGGRTMSLERRDLRTFWPEEDDLVPIFSARAKRRTHPSAGRHG